MLQITTVIDLLGEQYGFPVANYSGLHAKSCICLGANYR